MWGHWDFILAVLDPTQQNVFFMVEEMVLQIEVLSLCVMRLNESCVELNLTQHLLY